MVRAPVAVPDVAATGPLLVGVILLVGLVVGLVSTVVPVLAVEAYVLSSALILPLPLALAAAAAAAVGQTVGKVLVFLTSRRAGEHWNREDGERHPSRQFRRPGSGRVQGGRTERVRRWIAGVNARALRLLGGRLGPVVVMSSGAVGLPPLLLVSGCAGLSRMRIQHFSVMVLLSRAGRFGVLVLVQEAW